MTLPPLHAVIMAGGSGTRFWPASRSARPKQFLPLAHGMSLLEATIRRVEALAGRERTWIVTNPRQAELCARLLPDFPAAQILIEPEARDTAPCVALAAAAIEAKEPGAVLAVMPADHVITPEAAFHALLRRGQQLAADGTTLVTFGIAPTRAATGYGYIELGAALDAGTPRAHAVARFREKPDLATAQHFLATGRHLWNSGIFVWTTRALLAAMDQGAPDLAAATRTLLQAFQRDDRAAIDTTFRACRKISIDYAVMEKAPRVAVVRAELAWDDVGSFVTLGTVAGHDAAGNVVLGAAGGAAVVHEARDCVAYVEGARTIALFGVHDLVVVAVDDAVLVCPKDRAEDLKSLVQKLQSLGRQDLL